MSFYKGICGNESTQLEMIIYPHPAPLWKFISRSKILPLKATTYIFISLFTVLFNKIAVLKYSPPILIQVRVS